MPRGRAFFVGIAITFLGLSFFIFFVNFGPDLDSIQKQLALPARHWIATVQMVTVLLTLAMVVGGFAVIIMTILSEDKPNGLPLTDIILGTHKIAFMKVFQVGNSNASVQIVIEKSDLNSMSLGSNFLFFKFPIQTFEGEIKIINDADRLVVTVSGEKEQFKKLHLKKK